MPEYTGSIQQAAQKQNKDKNNKKGKKNQEIKKPIHGERGSH